MAERTTKLGPFTAGIDNRVRDFALSRNALRDAVNVDLPNSGQPRRRGGCVLITPGARVRSLWSNGRQAFFADGSTLRSFAPNGETSVMFEGVDPNARIAYCDVPGRGVTFSDDRIIKRITPDGVVRPFALDPVAVEPTVTAGTNGALAAGWYQVGLTYLDAFGEESGLVYSPSVYVEDAGRITVQLVPPTQLEVAATRVYLSARNSANPYLMGTVTRGAMSSVDLAFPGDGATRPMQQYMVPLTPGSVLASYNGRTYSASGSVLRFTDPYSGNHNPLRGFISFPAPITMLAPTPDGMWIVAHATYFMGGEPETGSLREISPLTAVRGTLVRLPDNKQSVWFTPKGLVQAGPGGAFQLLQEPRVAVDPAEQGAALYREQDGIQQVITTLRDSGASIAGASSWFTVKVDSRETRNEL
jgi:hypothetical protein